MLPTSIALLIRQARWTDASGELNKILSLHPFHSEALACLGYCLLKQNLYSDGIETLKTALTTGNTAFENYRNLCHALNHQGAIIESVQVAQTCVHMHSNLAEAHALLATTWEITRNHEYALDSFDNAARLNPTETEYQMGRLRTLTALGRHDECELLALRLHGMYALRQHPYPLMVLVNLRQRRSEWKTLPNLQLKLLQILQVSPTQNNALSHFSDDPALLLRMATNEATSAAASLPLPLTSPNGRTVICYLSADFRDHPVARMLAEVLPFHDRTHYRIILLRINPSDDSPIANHLASLVDDVIDLAHQPDIEAVETVRKIVPHAVIDLMGLTHGNRIALLQRRLAPVQLLWMGTTASTGLTCYDGFLVDDIVAPVGYNAFTTEPLIRLPHCYHPIGCGPVDLLPDKSRAELGLPATPAILVGMPQSPERVQPAFVENVARRISSHPRAHLILRGQPTARPAMLKLLTTWGLSAERICFLDHYPDRGTYLRAIQHLDLYIDTAPYGGHSTAGEAVKLGVPVLTAFGRCMHARVAGSMMTTLGLGDLVCADVPSQMNHLTELMGNNTLLTLWTQRFRRIKASDFSAHHQKLAQSIESTVESFLKPKNTLSH